MLLRPPSGTCATALPLSGTMFGLLPGVVASIELNMVPRLDSNQYHIFSADNPSCAGPDGLTFDLSTSTGTLARTITANLVEFGRATPSEVRSKSDWRERRTP
jgi:hypothetical protein